MELRITRRGIRTLGVIVVLFLPPALLMPRALFCGWDLSRSEARFHHDSVCPWHADPAYACQGALREACPDPQALTAAEADLRHEPNRAFADRILGSGHLPVWNPMNGFGEPFLGHARAGALNPLDALRFFLPPDRSLAWRAAFWLVLAGWFTYRLLRLLGLYRLPALTGAICFEMNGLLLSWIQLPHLRCAVLLPLVLWMTERLLVRPDSGRAAWVALAAGLVFLADHPETGGLVLLTGVAYGLIRGALSLRDLGGLRRVRAGWIWLAIAYGLGTGLGWVQIQLTATDGSWPWTGAPPALPVESLLGLFAPGMFGSPVDGWWGPGPTLEGAVYIGILPLLSALVAVVSSFFNDARVRVYTLLALFSAAAALGLPGLTQFLHGLPGSGGLPFHHLSLAVGLAGAALAALGLQRGLVRIEMQPLPRLVLLAPAGILVLGLLVALYVFVEHHPDASLAAIWDAGPLARLAGRMALALGLCASGLVLFFWNPPSGRLQGLRIAPLLLVILDLWIHGHETVGEIPCQDRARPRCLETLAPDARLAGQGLVLPPRRNLVLGYRDVRGAQSGEIPAMTALLARLMPSDTASGLTRAGPGAGLEKLGIDAWFSEKPLGPEGVWTRTGGPNPRITRFPLMIPDPVRCLVLHTSLTGALALPDRTPVARITVRGTDRRVKVLLRAGQETGDQALLQNARIAQHTRPEPSGFWIEHDPGGDSHSRHCYALAVDLDPPFVPLELEVEYTADQGWLNLHRIKAGHDPHPYTAVQTLGPEEFMDEIYRRQVLDAGPDAFLSPAYQVLETGSAVADLLASPVHDPRARTVLADKPRDWTGPRSEKEAEEPVQCDVVEDHPGRFAVKVSERSLSAVLVLRVTFHPGWSARGLGGEVIPLQAVDGAFLGAVLPPGPARTLTFSFHPRSLTRGLWISCIALAWLIIFFVTGIWARREPVSLSGTEPRMPEDEGARSEDVEVMPEPPGLPGENPRSWDDETDHEERTPES